MIQDSTWESVIFGPQQIYRLSGMGESTKRTAIHLYAYELRAKGAPYAEGGPVFVMSQWDMSWGFVSVAGLCCIPAPNREYTRGTQLIG